MTVIRPYVMGHCKKGHFLGWLHSDVYLLMQHCRGASQTACGGHSGYAAR